VRYLFLVLLVFALSVLSPADTCKGKITCEDGSSATCEQEYNEMEGERCRIENLNYAIQCTVYSSEDEIVGQPYVNLCWESFDIPFEP